MLGYSLAILAGFCAAMASTCAKLAFSPDIIQKICGIMLTSDLCEQMLIFIQIICFSGLFVCNGLMWTLFVKSLQKCQSSVEATITNTASNFFFSAVIGWTLFGETLKLMWWLGAGFILIGLIFIYHSNPQEKKKTS